MNIKTICRTLYVLMYIVACLVMKFGDNPVDGYRYYTIVVCMIVVHIAGYAEGLKENL